MNNIFFIELTDAYGSKVYVNLSNVDWMEHTKEQIGTVTVNYIRLHCGGNWVRVTETIEQIQEKLLIISKLSDKE
jgi:3-keto-L-gulonate-6-phosphate decarboxylase